MKATPLLTTLLTAVLLCSCASPKTESAQKTEKAPEKDEYVNYTPIGSWVAKKVKKSKLKTSEQLTEQTQDAMRNLQTSAPGYPADIGR